MFLVSVGHDTTIGTVTIVKRIKDQVFEYFEECSEFEMQNNICIIMDLEKPIFIPNGAFFLASRLDLLLPTEKKNQCRFAFYGNIDFENASYSDADPKWNIFKRKQKIGYVDRVITLLVLF